MKRIIIVGLGEVGKPLCEIESKYHDVVGVDINPVKAKGRCDVLQLCFPFKPRIFVEQSITYIRKYKPRLTIVNSTVVPGTTRAIWKRTRVPIAHSPVRGKHANMKAEMLQYAKFVGGISVQAGQKAAQHFHSIGLNTKVFACPEVTELAKLTETTYFGLIIAWAQEVERYCDQLRLKYDDVASFYDEIAFLPRVQYFPGVIGGHCVMPNISLLKTLFQSAMLDGIQKSNEMKQLREIRMHSKQTVSNNSPPKARTTTRSDAPESRWVRERHISL